MKVELFHAPGCAQCATAEASLKKAALKVVADLSWREVNVLDELDYAVELGILTLPAVVIDRELVFASLPTPGQLREALVQRAQAAVR